MNSHPHSTQRQRRRPYRTFHIATGVATAVLVTYGTYRLATWAWNEWCSSSSTTDTREDHRIPEEQEDFEQEDEPTDELQTLKLEQKEEGEEEEKEKEERCTNQRRDRSLQRCYSEVCMAYEDFLPTVRIFLERSTDVSVETKTLKRLRTMAEKQDHSPEEEEEKLWNRIKVKYLTRMIATTYSHTLLWLILHVQVHLLGGRLFVQNEAEEVDNVLKAEKEKTKVQIDRTLHFQTLKEDKEPTFSTTVPQDFDCAHSTISSYSSSSILLPSLSTQKVDTPIRQQDYHSVHRIVLSKTYDYFFQCGFNQLIDFVTLAIGNELKEWNVTSSNSNSDQTLSTSNDHKNSLNHRNLTEKNIGSGHELTREQFRNGIHIIRQQVESMSQEQQSLVQRFFIPSLDKQNDFFKDSCTETLGPDQISMIQYVLHETWDILESPLFDLALRQCLDCNFRTLEEFGWSKIFMEENDLDQNNHSQMKNDPHNRFAFKPLASIITQLKKNILRVFYDSVDASQESTSHSQDMSLLWNTCKAETMLHQGQRRYPNICIQQLESLESLNELGRISFN